MRTARFEARGLSLIQSELIRRGNPLPESNVTEVVQALSPIASQLGYRLSNQTVPITMWLSKDGGVAVITPAEFASGRLVILGADGRLLHDIGMLKIPDSLYLNPHQLGPKEWQMIKPTPC
jgi:response regulator RpfG family c-di-GMP phosphodiesterase